MSTKRYIGDAVYAEFDEYGGITLTTEDGVSTSNSIYLEPEVFVALQKFELASRMDRSHG